MSLGDSQYPQFTARRHTRLRRGPLENPPEVDDAVRDRILEAAERLPRFTAAELVAELAQSGVQVEVDAVRSVLEA